MDLKLLSIGLIAAAMFATPATAREHPLAPRHGAGDPSVTEDAYASTVPYAPYASSCVQAPRVGAFATAPWTNEAPCEPWSAYHSGY
jgi:hypothetical protein